MKPMMIGKRRIGNDDPTLIIAEISDAHDDDARKASELIRAAAECGVQAVKVHKSPIKTASTTGTTQQHSTTNPGFGNQDWRSIFETAGEAGVALIVDIADVASLDAVASLDVAAFKIHTRNINNTELLKNAAATGKPLMLETTGVTFNEIETALATFRNTGGGNVLLMHGFKNAANREAKKHNLRLIQKLKKSFGCWVGFQDHTDTREHIALTLPMVAAALGAVAIEKHFDVTPSDESDGYRIALDPDSMRQLVEDLGTVDGTYRRTAGGAKKEAGQSRQAEDAAEVESPGLGILKGSRLADFTPPIVGKEGFVGRFNKASFDEDSAVVMSELTARVTICIDARKQGECLARIEGQTALGHLIDRLKSCKLDASIVLCTVAGPEGEPMIDVARQKKIPWNTAKAEAPLEGIEQVTRLTQADAAVIVPAENILVDPYHIDLLVRRHVEATVDCTRPRGLPDGLGCTVIDPDVLAKAVQQGTLPNTIDFFADTERFQTQTVTVDAEYRRNYQLAARTPENIQTLRDIFRNLETPQEIFSIKNLLDYLDHQTETLEMQQTSTPDPFSLEPIEERRTYPSPASTQTYTLSDSGYAFIDAEESRTVTLATH